MCSSDLDRVNRGGVGVEERREPVGSPGGFDNRMRGAGELE